MRLLTWNVNSLRLRLGLDQFRQVMERLDPDVVCLQETKVRDEDFPEDACRALGFPHIARRGEPGYNGVAVLSRHPMRVCESGSWCGRDDARHLGVQVRGITVHCLYVPAGGYIPDSQRNPKFAHKLAFLDALTAWSAGAGAQGAAVVTGDLNVAPLETDVWDHRKMLRVVSHTPPETERLENMRTAGGWVDAMRRFVPDHEKLFTWWSYRAGANWREADRGRRLDHVWVTPDLAPRLRGMTVMKEARGWERPSDHVPVAVDLAPPSG